MEAIRWDLLLHLLRNDKWLGRMPDLTDSCSIQRDPQRNSQRNPQKLPHQRQIQSPAPVEEQTPVPERSREQLFGKEPGGQQAECEPGMCPGTRKTNGILSLMRQSSASRLREVTLPLSTTEAHLQCWHQFWASKYWSYWTEGLEHLSYEERVRAGTAQP